MKHYYTGVGSRKTDKQGLFLLNLLAKEAFKRGLILRSGAADGADTAFEIEAGDQKEIFLPWKNFNNNPSRYHSPSKGAEQIASQIHPKWHGLSYGAKLLHSRNVHQVLGPDLTTPSDFLIAWTEDGKTVGGTATAIRLAEKHNIPVFNIGHAPNFDLAMAYIEDNYND